MAKDRFSKQKPINWHIGFKNTGSFIRPYKSEVPKDKAPKKTFKHRTREEQDLLDITSIWYYNKMNEWEKTFIDNLRFKPFACSEKQLKKIDDIIEKYHLMYPEIREYHFAI